MSGCINTQHKEQEEEDQEQEHQQDQTIIIPNYPQPFQGPNFPLLPGPHMHYQESTDPFLPLSGGGGGRSGLVFPPHEITPILPWGPLQPAHHTFNHFPSNPDPFLSSSYATLFGRRGSAPPQHHQHLQFSAYDVGAPSSSSVDPLRILSEALGQPGGAPFGLQMQAELNRMTAQEIMDAKALAASKSHSEAERRRRERINNHLAKLRSLLPSTTKTDKASLLAEVIQHVKELKRQTTVVMETTSVPTESDELTVDPAAEVDSDGRVVVKASLCCDDRNDLLPDLIKALKALHLRTLKAEITTLGGRVKNVLFVTGEDGSGGGEDGGGESSSGGGDQWSISSIQEALRAVMEKSGGGSSGGGREDSATGNAKRQRTNSNANIIT